MFKLKIFLFASVVINVLIGCGGSSGSKSEILISGDLTPAVGQSIALIATVAGERTDEFSINWTQTSGTELPLIAANSAVLAFDLIVAGSYSFRVDITTKDGEQLTKDIEVHTTAAVNSLNVRRDFASREGNKVSFKLSQPTDPITGSVVAGEFTKIQWLQTAGPTITLDDNNTNPYIAIFDAPVVLEDSIATFEVSAIHPNGTTVTDNVFLLVQDIEQIPESAMYASVVAKIHPYNANAAAANSLTKCIYYNYFTTPCSLSSINLIGQNYSQPSVDNIMDRVITSHPWMADNFKRFLMEQDPHDDFKKLLRSVSAIVIAYDIRPSYYWVATGAMYLDPEDLWLTPEQRDVIDVAPDYRSEFGQELQYIMPWRYVKGNDYASHYYPQESRTTRTVEELVPDLGSLLYHELAHANDNFPSSSLATIQGVSIVDAYQQRAEQSIANQLAARYPKLNAEMMGLGQVNFRGASATTLQKSYTPHDVAYFFRHDNAPTEYAYSSIQEDVATLFDAAMMSARYGIERDEAVVSLKNTHNPSLSYILSWGQRGRITDPAVLPRSTFVFERIFPGIDSAGFYATLPPARALKAGVSWQDALTAGFIESDDAPLKVSGQKVQRPMALDLMRRYK